MSGKEKDPIIDENGKLTISLIVYGKDPHQVMFGKTKKLTASALLAVLTNNLNNGKHIMVFPKGSVYPK